MSIQQTRQLYRQTRHHLPSSTQNRNADLLKQNINDSLGLSSCLKIAAYMAVQGEISLNPWISDNSKNQIYLPKLYEKTAPQLKFAELTATTHWKRNRFNILEPDIQWEDCLDPQEFDIILVPLVAFDRQGYRLGMGGGYYDRSLAFRHSQQKQFKPKLIGVAHSCQEHPQLPHQSWDIPMDRIITEKEIIVPQR